MRRSSTRSASRQAKAGSAALLQRAREAGYNLRDLGGDAVAIALDETVRERDLVALWTVFNGGKAPGFDADDLADENAEGLQAFARTSPYLAHPVFNTHHTETEMLRYLRRLESRDLSLTHSMIPLGSCTMKLNATAEMFPISWPEFARLHPFAPADQLVGNKKMCDLLEAWLAEITGFAAVSLQPNAGSQGEYAGLLAIRAYHRSRGEGHRKVCLIPQSAHGTNPASAVMVGFKVVPVATLKDGDIDLADLRKKAEQHATDLAALMVTYPSTHGVFEPTIREVCEIVHSHGGQVYMDGANMNAQVGLCRPGDFGPDVCHLNLHKTFCIPHGGGGPGVGPIGVAKHLAPFLPAEASLSGDVGNGETPGPVAAAPYGSASILTISWMYIRMMGAEGLTEATKVAILTQTTSRSGSTITSRALQRPRRARRARVHRRSAAVQKRRRRSGRRGEAPDGLRFSRAHGVVSCRWHADDRADGERSERRAGPFLRRNDLHSRRDQAVVNGAADKADNVLKNAPHTARSVSADEWTRPYSRQQAAYPAPWTREAKFWPTVARIDNVYGDRNLVCSCPPMDAFA
jgi:glycine dehydrogenase